jgi:hypothetical protein
LRGGGVYGGDDRELLAGAEQGGRAVLQVAGYWEGGEGAEQGALDAGELLLVGQLHVRVTAPTV